VILLRARYKYNHVWGEYLKHIEPSSAIGLFSVSSNCSLEKPLKQCFSNCGCRTVAWWYV